MASPTLMRTTEFLRFLSAYCEDMQEAISSDDKQKQVYADIDKMIHSYLLDYKAAKRLTQEAEASMLEAIENDRRRGFESEKELIRHVCRIASKPPFFDSAAISLAAIRGFTNDYLQKENANDHHNAS